MLAVSAGPAFAAPKPLPRPAPVANDALTRALAQGHLTPAAYTLERARSLFHLAEVRREFGDVERAAGHDATLILRDLALRLRDLPAGEREEARRLLARPSDGFGNDDDGWLVAEAPDSQAGEGCDTNVCIHWVNSTADAPPAGDTDADGVPNWVEDVVQPTFATVWATEVTAFGNPMPKSDLSSTNDGGDAKLDVYLADLGNDGLFGYCTSDDPNLDSPGYPFFDFSSYCVLDDDFADFGTEWTPTQFTQVVAAHEFRHASQFAEDFAEDLWLMEGEAMWMEGQVYPTVTDRFDYLQTSPLSRPSNSLDHGKNFYEYGAWVFFQYLSERFGDDVVRKIWDRADGSSSGPDQYSMEATSNAIAAEGAQFYGTFTTFTEWNRFPAGPGHYSEGPSYPTAPRSGTFRLGRGDAISWKTIKMRHLAAAYYSFKPASDGRTKAGLKVTVDLPATSTKPAATLLVFTAGGGYSVKPITLDSSGNGARTVGFGRGTVTRIDLMLTNASARYDLSTCWSGLTTYSCGGAKARDENLAYKFRARTT